MKRLVYFLFVGCLFLLPACKKKVNAGPSANDSTSINKIMPLGASRVEGDTPSFESYRYQLWKSLVAGGYDFDVVGTELDESIYVDVNEQVFDADHEGRSGITAASIKAELPGWLNEGGAPDIVLFSSPGGNDLLNGESTQNVIVSINSIIDILQEKNPNVTIIVEQMAPASAATMTPAFTVEYDEMLQEIAIMAQQQTSATSSVIVVDMATGFDDAEFLADDVHYNSLGAAFVAKQYYEVLKNILL